jgi:predicted DsbA family dithiol-disulfide isomerase
VWAYIAELRVAEVKANFGDAVRFENRFCNVFGATARKIQSAWGGAHGYDKFNAHLREAAARFPEVKLSTEIWLKARPASSLSAHLFLKAAQLASEGEADAISADKAIRAMRTAFFERNENVADRGVQRSVCEAVGVDVDRAEALIKSGEAHAALMADYLDADTMKVSGSPTFLLNEGRQKLYGNVGYRVIEANIQELLREPASGQASWC